MTMDPGTVAVLMMTIFAVAVVLLRLIDVLSGDRGDEE